MDLTVREVTMNSSPTSGPALTAWRLLGILSLPLFAPPLLALSLSLKINKLKNKIQCRMGKNKKY